MGATPDVRVRLSAEGELSIINAFKRIQAQAEQTGRVGSRGLDALSLSSFRLGRLLPGLSFAAAIAGATALAKNAVETGDQFAKLSQRTGISVETLSTYAHGATLAGLDTEDLAKGLARLSKNMGLAAQGGQVQIAAFQRVGITQKQLQTGSITLDQALLRISGHLAGQADGWQKSAEAQALFGRTADRLIPFLNQGPAALDELAAAAKRLGLVWSTEDALAAQEFEDNLKLLRATVQGFTNRELVVLLPMIIDLTKGLLGLNDGLRDGITLSENAAINLLTLAAANRFLVKSVAATTLLGPAGLILSATKFWADFKGELGSILGLIDEAKERSAKVPLPVKPTKPEAPIIDEGARGKALDAARRLADAQLALKRGELDNELALVKANNAATSAEEQARFKEGLIAVQAFFATRRALLESEAEKEIVLLEQESQAIRDRIAAAEAQPLKQKEPPAVREAEITKLRTDLAKSETERDVRIIALEGQRATLAGEEREAVRQFNVEQLDFAAKLAAAQGQHFAADRIDLAAQIAGLQRLKGETDAAFAGRKEALQAAGEAQIHFAEVQAQARQTLSEIESARLGIEVLVQRGVITEFEGQQQIAALEKERLPILEQIAVRMMAAAVTPEQIEAARQFSDQIKQLAANSDIAGQRMADFKRALDQALTSDLSNWLSRGIDDAKSFGDAFRGLALSVVQSLREIVAQMIATIIITQLLKSVLGFAGGAGAGSGTITAGTAGGGSGAIAGASGGLVRGPGTSTSDSIAARLSAGEYVVRAAAVKSVGIQFMEDLNSFHSMRLRPIGHVRSFAAGGLVVDGDGQSKAGRDGHIRAEFVTDIPQLLKRVDASPDFRRLIVRTVQENRKSINAALGRG